MPCRPRLSLRLRALPLRRPALSRGLSGLFPDCQARAVRLPERFRGRLLLRRRQAPEEAKRTLPRGLPAASRRRRMKPWLRPPTESTTTWGQLARGVVAELGVRHLEADQVLERGPGHRIAHRRIA